MTLKKATENDISLIQQLAEKSWRANYPGIISEEQIDYMLNLMYSQKEIKSQFLNINYHYYLIFDKENIAVGIMGYENSYQHNITKLHRLYLLAEVKGKGYGRYALDFLKKEVQKSLDSSIILNVNKENLAFGFYKSQGFKVFKETIVDIGNGFVMDDYIMELIF